MTAMIEVQESAGKTVALVLTFGMAAWIEKEAAERRISKSKVVREVIEKAMRESEGRAA